MPGHPQDPTTTRRLLVVGVAVGVFVVLAGVARWVAVPELELDVFRWFNGWPDALAAPLWPVMQLGSLWLGTVVGALVMGVLRGWRGALVAVVTATGAWALAVIAKAWVCRGRPAEYLDGVDARFDHLPDGYGYPSGHAAVAFSLAALVAGSPRGRWRLVPYLLACLVGVGRLCFGAHLPLDVIGGAALGCAVGVSARFLLPNRESLTPTLDGSARREDSRTRTS